MNLFFDTSALVKSFHEEEGSEVITQLLTSQGNEIWISELVRLEFMSALFRGNFLVKYWNSFLFIFRIWDNCTCHCENPAMVKLFKKQPKYL